MTFEDFTSRFDKVIKTSHGVMVRCPAHQDSTPSLQISRATDGKILLKCFGGCDTTSVVSSLGLAMKDLFPDTPSRKFSVPASNGHEAPTEKPVVEKTYQYRDATGREVYQVVRMRPKSFRQRHPSSSGEWVWNMDGVERVLFRLPEILKSPEVWVCEGEKDAENLSALGFCGTCNVGGAGKWLDAYTEHLAGKDVCICGDTDAAGEKHVELVFDSIAGKAKSVRLVKLPKTVKDVSDYFATFKTPEEAAKALTELRESAHPFIKGIKMPIYTMAELEPRYQRYVANLAGNSFSLGKWLPSLGRLIRPLVCGELAFIIGDTGSGKTAIIQTIAKSALPLPTLLFELELPSELMFERFVAGETKLECKFVEDAYKSGQSMPEILEKRFKNLFICTESRLTLQDFENYILRSELKIGEKPKVVLIDYIQLVGATGPNRREKVSDIAEGLKILAKVTNTIIIVSSQVRRPGEGHSEIGLHSAKESGSIESSSGLLLGCWRDEQDASLMHVSVLKSTKGGGGAKVECNFDGSRMILTERTQEP